ncbi:AhpC-TSA-domain-containing protein [Mycena kentingensis (nom. inval.)]|nr:AhpC-TSA-domain-containing protein [Mycena kentingensis (nom. inval.)]
MPPRKAAAAADDAPRRSSRTSTIKASADSVKEAAAKLVNAGKKRKAAEDKPAKTTKKAKADAEDKDDEEEAAEEEPEVATIDIGDSLPSLTLKNEKDEDVEVSSLTEDKGLVLFLVPKADTPGCTTQACAFRDVYADFTGLDYNVYCLSSDLPKAQAKWQTKKELPYPLLSDPKRTLITVLGAGEGGKTKRSHFVFAKGGKLLEKKIPVKAADSSKLALEFIKSQTA